jgi:hypothetical protein
VKQRTDAISRYLQERSNGPIREAPISMKQAIQERPGQLGESAPRTVKAEAGPGRCTI